MTCSLLAVGLAGLVELQPLAGALPLSLGERLVLQGLLLVLDGLLEVPRLGVGRTEGVDVVGLFPSGQLAGPLRQLDGLLAVAVLLVGAGGGQPGPAVHYQV